MARCGQCRGRQGPSTVGTRRATLRRVPDAEGTVFQHRGQARHQAATVNNMPASTKPPQQKTAHRRKQAREQQGREPVSRHQQQSNGHILDRWLSKSCRRIDSHINLAQNTVPNPNVQVCRQAWPHCQRVLSSVSTQYYSSSLNRDDLMKGGTSSVIKSYTVATVWTSMHL